MSGKPHRPTAEEQRRQQQRQQASQAAKAATANRDQLHEIAERALMQRQGKQLHKQDGK